jgi:hypothetical protein
MTGLQFLFNPHDHNVYNIRELNKVLLRQCSMLPFSAYIYRNFSHGLNPSISDKLSMEVSHDLKAINLKHHVQQSMCRFEAADTSVRSKLVIVFERAFSRRNSHLILPSSSRVIAAWPFCTGIGGYWPLPSHIGICLTMNKVIHHSFPYVLSIRAILHAPFSHVPPAPAPAPPAPAPATPPRCYRPVLRLTPLPIHALDLL